jgi:hypothetical protein
MASHFLDVLNEVYLLFFLFSKSGGNLMMKKEYLKRRQTDEGKVNTFEGDYHT